MELVEADQAIALRDAFGHLIERILHTFDFVKLAMHAAHEFVKMQTSFTLNRHGRVKRVHQKAFPTSDTSPEVYPSGHIRTLKQPLDGAGAIVFKRDPVVKIRLQALDSDALGGVWLITAFSQTALIILKNVQECCTRVPQKLRVRLSTANAASFMDSDNVGCA